MADSLAALFASTSEEKGQQSVLVGRLLFLDSTTGENEVQINSVVYENLPVVNAATIVETTGNGNVLLLNTPAGPVILGRVLSA